MSADEKKEACCLLFLRLVIRTQALIRHALRGRRYSAKHPLPARDIPSFASDSVDFLNPTIKVSSTSNRIGSVSGMTVRYLSCRPYHEYDLVFEC